MKFYTLEGSSRINPLSLDPKQLSDFEAGIHYLATVSQYAPGIKIGQLFNRDGLMGWSLSKSLSSAWKGTKEVFSSVGSGTRKILDYGGKKVGETVRLLADEDVQQLATRAGAAYASGGGSLAAEGMFDNIFGKGSGANVSDFINQIGAFWKRESSGVNAASAAPGIDNRTLMIAGGGLIGAVLLISLLRK